MHVNDLPEELLLKIFGHLNLTDLRKSGQVCQKWTALTNRRWASRLSLHFMDLVCPTQPPTTPLPKGRRFNKILHYVLKKCGRRLKILDLHDPWPEFRCLKINENSFKIIGKFCPNLQEINLSGLSIVNDLLHSFVKYVDCSKIGNLNLNSSFNHFCVVHDGLGSLYSACGRLTILNISNSVNARVRDCSELWPPTLTQVYLDNAWALTNYSLISLAKCCPSLTLFSMNGHMGGMDAGLEYLMAQCQQISDMSLREYPGSVELGLKIGQLPNLSRLHLGDSKMACDAVLTNLAEKCENLTVLECDLTAHSTEPQSTGLFISDVTLIKLAEKSKNLREISLKYRKFITDVGLKAILSTIRMETIILASCPGVSKAFLHVLAENCSELQFLDISHCTNINGSEFVENLCQAWFLENFKNPQKSSKKWCQTLEIAAEGVPVDFKNFKANFSFDDPSNRHKFSFMKNRNLYVQFYSDMLLSIFE